MSIKPLVIGVTMGDPAGIGAEITTALLAERIDEKEVRAVLIGCAKMVEETARRKGLNVSIRRMKSLNVMNLDQGSLMFMILRSLMLPWFSLVVSVKRLEKHQCFTIGKVLN